MNQTVEDIDRSVNSITGDAEYINLQTRSRGPREDQRLRVFQLQLDRLRRQREELLKRYPDQQPKGVSTGRAMGVSAPTGRRATGNVKTPHSLMPEAPVERTPLFRPGKPLPTHLAPATAGVKRGSPAIVARRKPVIEVVVAPQSLAHNQLQRRITTVLGAPTTPPVNTGAEATPVAVAPVAMPRPAAVAPVSQAPKTAVVANIMAVSPTPIKRPALRPRVPVATEVNTEVEAEAVLPADQGVQASDTQTPLMSLKASELPIPDEYLSEEVPDNIITSSVMDEMLAAEGLPAADPDGLSFGAFTPDDYDQYVEPPAPEPAPVVAAPKKQSKLKPASRPAAETPKPAVRRKVVPRTLVEA